MSHGNGRRIQCAWSHRSGVELCPGLDGSINVVMYDRADRVVIGYGDTPDEAIDDALRVLSTTDRRILHRMVGASTWEAGDRRVLAIRSAIHDIATQIKREEVMA